jgi:hypothetical protein
MLKFSPANTKTKRLKAVIPTLRGKIYSLDLPSGYTCPGAKLCKSRAVGGDNGRFTIVDGPDCQFRCFSASQEVIFPNVRKVRWHNHNELVQAKTVKGMTKLILESIPKNCGAVRLHVGGDIFSKNYLLALLSVAQRRPDIQWYTYTKSLQILQNVLSKINLPLDLPNGVLLPNFHITASYGGKYDNLIGKLNIRSCKVVFSEQQAIDASLLIDHTDEHALQSGGNFSILLHGIQPANSLASTALKLLGGNQNGKGKYTR